MSRKHFSWLLLVTVVVAILVLLMPGKAGKESSFEKAALLPGLQEQVNAIDWLRLTGAGSVTIATLRRVDDHWILEESSGYRADWKRLKTVLSDLAQAEIIEAKTSNPDYFDRLGVEDASLENAGGVLVEFSASSGLPAVIIGKNAQARNGRYVRLQDSSDSALIDRDLDLPKDRQSWLERDIISIPETEVVEVEINHPDGDRVLARKLAVDDENFELEAIPEGFDVKSDWTVNSLANSLASLQLESVLPDGEIDWGGAIRFRLVTAEGLQVEADLVERSDEAQGTEEEGETETTENEYWLRLASGLYLTALESGVEQVEDISGTRDRAGEINLRNGGWAYRIPKYKFDSMTKRMDDLLKSADS